MNRLYFDWSGGAIHTITDESNDGKLPKNGKDEKAFEDVRIFPNFDFVFESLNEPTVLIGEATFESFVLEKRREVIARAKREGHRILSTPNRQTGRHRRSLGYSDEDKSDFLDVYVLRDLANNTTTHLKSPRVLDDNDPFLEKRNKANHELMILRNTKIMRESKRSPRGYTFDSAKDLWAKELIGSLPKYDSLTETQRIILGDGKAYGKSLVAAVGMATKYAGGRREFDRLCGLYHHGYPSQIRSDLYLHRWGKQLREDSKGKNAGKVTLNDFRRELRWLYHRLVPAMKK